MLGATITLLDATATVCPHQVIFSLPSHCCFSAVWDDKREHNAIGLFLAVLIMVSRVGLFSISNLLIINIFLEKISDAIVKFVNLLNLNTIFFYLSNYYIRESFGIGIGRKLKKAVLLASYNIAWYITQEPFLFFLYTDKNKILEL